MRRLKSVRTKAARPSEKSLLSGMDTVALGFSELDFDRETHNDSSCECDSLRDEIQTTQLNVANSTTSETRPCSKV